MKKILLMITVMLLSINIFADAKGDEIAKKNFNLKESKDSYSIATMILINSNNDKKTRKIEMYSKEGKEGRDSFIKFLEPADVKGTTFLTTAHKTSDDEQRLYLPALGKVRRISSSDKDGKFMGSDLFYYDMEDHDYEDYTYSYIKEDVYDGKNCFVIEMYPKDTNAPYSKQKVWIAKDDYFAYKIECYDKKGNKGLIKTLVMLNIKNIDGVLIPERIVVDNHKENHKTLLQRENIKINIGLKDSIFTVQNLTK